MAEMKSPQGGFRPCDKPKNVRLYEIRQLRNPVQTVLLQEPIALGQSAEDSRYDLDLVGLVSVPDGVCSPIEVHDADAEVPGAKSPKFPISNSIAAKYLI